MSKRRSEKLEEAYTKQDKALRKLAEIEQQFLTWKVRTWKAPA